MVFFYILINTYNFIKFTTNILILAILDILKSYVFLSNYKLYMQQQKFLKL